MLLPEKEILHFREKISLWRNWFPMFTCLRMTSPPASVPIMFWRTCLSSSSPGSPSCTTWFPSTPSPPVLLVRSNLTALISSKSPWRRSLPFYHHQCQDYPPHSWEPRAIPLTEEKLCWRRPRKSWLRLTVPAHALSLLPSFRWLRGRRRKETDPGPAQMGRRWEAELRLSLSKLRRNFHVLRRQGQGADDGRQGDISARETSFNFLEFFLSNRFQSTILMGIFTLSKAGRYFPVVWREGRGGGEEDDLLPVRDRPAQRKVLFPQLHGEP